MVATLAKEAALPVNVVDMPEEGTFIFPAIIDRSPVLVSVSSSGESPVLARLLRSKLESLVPSAYGRLAHLIGQYRETVKSALPQINQRRGFWESVLQGPLAELVFAGQEKEAEERLRQSIEDAKFARSDNVGEVYLVGAGPGDPDLLTFRALRLMQQADVVLYDRLVSKEILNMTRRDAQHIHVGKERANHTLPQEEINNRLVSLAKKGASRAQAQRRRSFYFWPGWRRN